jgi:hypothetical protein
MARFHPFDWVLPLALLACGREQHTSILPPDAGAAGGDAGAPAVLDDGGVADASVSDGDTRDGGTDAGDDGDAAPDGPLPSLDGRCVEGTLDDYCGGESSCPSRQTVLARFVATGASLVVQRPCQSETGGDLISVGYSFLNNAGVRIYDAQSGELVSVYLLDDVADHCDNRAADAFYGDLLPDCMFESPGDIPSICYEYRGASADGGLGQPTPDECVFVEE